MLGGQSFGGVFGVIIDSPRDIRTEVELRQGNSSLPLLVSLVIQSYFYCWFATKNSVT